MGIGGWLLRAFSGLGARHRITLAETRPREVVPALRNYPVERRSPR